MRRNWLIAVSCGLGITMLGACGNRGSDRVTSVDVTGRVDGGAFFDANGNLVFDGGDTTMTGVLVQLLERTTEAVIASDVTDNQGVFSIADVPVGDYLVSVDSASIGDTVVVANISQATVNVGPADSVPVTVAISYPFVSTNEARGSAIGRKIFVSGVALNALSSFGDTTLHVADTAGALRTSRVRQQPIVTGDSVRLLGRRNERDGQPTLDDVTPFLVSIGTLPTAVVVTSAEAASADGGRLDAWLIRTIGLNVIDTMTVQNVMQDFVATSDDGSGEVDVYFSTAAGFNLTGVEPGVVLDLTGVLVPDGLGNWRLKPRFQSDLFVR